MDMTKILKVIKPFFVMENGDTFEYNADTDQYESVYNEEHNSSNEDNSTVVSSYNSVYRISKEYAKMLLDNGYVEEVDDKKRYQVLLIFFKNGEIAITYDKNLVINHGRNVPMSQRCE